MKIILRWFLIAIVTLSACDNVTIVVNEIPANTPKGAKLYVTGNFNYWDPADSRYPLEMFEDSTYAVTLPKGFGELEFLFSRGELSSIEGDDCGNDLSPRIVQYGANDTLFLAINSWKDLEAVRCPTVTLVLDKLPVNTPEDEEIHLVGDFNGWLPGEEELAFKKNQDSSYSLTIPKVRTDRIQFQLTRGSWETVECDTNGFELPKREFIFGSADTVKLEVPSWEDLTPKRNREITFIVSKLPKNTPIDSEIYIAGNFNNWHPRDNAYKLEQKPDKTYRITIPVLKNEIQYKFTRGGWETVECDARVRSIDNRITSTANTNEIYVDIQTWKDLGLLEKTETIIQISSLPENTPKDADLYIAGDFNRWKPGDPDYKMERTKNGTYYISLPKTWKRIEYKFTRGNWEKVEGNRVGKRLPNRKANLYTTNDIHVKIYSWEDLHNYVNPIVTFVIEEVPENTPESEDIFFVSNMNGWVSGLKNYRMIRQADGKYYLNIMRRRGTLEYKFNRGDWSTQELDGRGRTISNRRLEWINKDTVFVKIREWKDLRLRQ